MLPLLALPSQQVQELLWEKLGAALEQLQHRWVNTLKAMADQAVGRPLPCTLAFACHQFGHSEQSAPGGYSAGVMPGSSHSNVHLPPNQLCASAIEVWHLQRVLAKKRDPLSHTLFLDVVAPSDDDPLPLERFWCGAG